MGVRPPGRPPPRERSPAVTTTDRSPVETRTPTRPPAPSATDRGSRLPRRATTRTHLGNLAPQSPDHPHRSGTARARVSATVVVVGGKTGLGTQRERSEAAADAPPQRGPSPASPHPSTTCLVASSRNSRRCLGHPRTGSRLAPRTRSRPAGARSGTRPRTGSALA